MDKQDLLNDLAHNIFTTLREILIDFCESNSEILAKDVIDVASAGVFSALVGPRVDEASCAIAKRLIENILMMHTLAHEEKDNLAKNARNN